MSDVRKFTALAVASRAHGYTPKRIKAGDPHPLLRTDGCSDFLILKGVQSIDERKAKE